VPVGFLTDSQTREDGRFSGEPTPDQLARHFHLDDTDRGFVAEHRGDHNRLGVAIQLGSLRFLGTLLEDPAMAPASAVRFAADQLSITGSAELMRSTRRARAVGGMVPASSSATATAPSPTLESRSASTAFYMRCAGPVPTAPRRCSTAQLHGCWKPRCCYRASRCLSAPWPGFGRAQIRICTAC
jgi:Domain of unknown function (DUF4158)